MTFDEALDACLTRGLVPTELEAGGVRAILRLKETSAASQEEDKDDRKARLSAELGLPRG